MNFIPFNKPLVTGREKAVFDKLILTQKFCGDGSFTKTCHHQLQEATGSKKVLLTTSCTHALEMAALLSDINEGDEIIMSSFNFVSTANAFVLRGAKIIFVDIRPDTMNIDARLIQPAITSKTRCIVAMHYGGVSCEMDKILSVAKDNDLTIIEDAAQCIGATYNDKPLGTFGDFGTLSFHETKNIHCGEGGALLINNPDHFERAEIIREKGTNRSKFIKGIVDKYTWVDVGSSFLPSEFNAAILSDQLNSIADVTQKRLGIWRRYRSQLASVVEKHGLGIQDIPPGCASNGHLFYLICSSNSQRNELIDFLRARNVQASFHYIPLHSSPAGRKYGSFSGKDLYTTSLSERLVRLPMHFEITDGEVDYVCGVVEHFFN